ncbi:MAG TPA: winged helix DNA-binding domain-containing protein [Actinomycetota bacterium]|nr:winged helix DNA-binding domain-containing protein [Actinomycetota bacterium]
MPARTDGSAKILNARALNRATLARQLLLNRNVVTAEKVIEHLVGLQAQVPSDPYITLWSRIDNFDPQELSELLLSARAVRCGLMRGTIHLVTARDCVGLRPLMQPIYDRVYGKGRTMGGKLGDDKEAVTAACRQLLKERPRTRSEVRTLLAERWPQHDPEAMSFCLPTLPVVQIPPRGVWGKSGKARWALVEDWLPDQPAVAHAIDDVVLRYLGAFGPATVADVRQWCGLSGLKEVMDRLRPQLVTFRDDQGRELFDLPEAPRPDPETPAPPRFFAEFDNVFLSHADRSRMAPEEFREGMASVWLGMQAQNLPVGFGRPESMPINWSMFAVDGFLSGTWKLDRRKEAVTLIVRPMVRLSDDQSAELLEEARRLLDFLTSGSQIERSVEFL